MQGFAQWGDKLLAFITSALALAVTMAVGPTPALHINASILGWLTFGSGLATLAHTVFFPNSAPLPASTNKQGGFVRLGFLAFLGAFLLTACLLASCSSLGLATPQNTSQQIAYGYSGVTATLNTLAAATNAGQLSSSEAFHANAAILAVKGALDQANSAVSSNPSGAAALLNTATQALAAVSAYLTCKQQKGSTLCQMP